MKINFDDKVKVLILLYSLLGSWETVVAAVSNSSGKENLTLDGVRYLILSEDAWSKEPTIMMIREEEIKDQKYMPYTWKVKINRERRHGQKQSL